MCRFNMINRPGRWGNFGPGMNPKLDDDSDEEGNDDSDFLDDIDED